MIHRDIKLANFLIVKNEGSAYPLIKLSNFQFATTLDKDISAIVGTPLCVPVELFDKQNNDDIQITDKRDIYSLGICLYKLITNLYPFGTNPSEFFRAMKEKQPVEFPPDFCTKEGYKELVELTLKMTKHDVNERMSWEELRDNQYIHQLLNNY